MVISYWLLVIVNWFLVMVDWLGQGDDYSQWSMFKGEKWLLVII